MSFNKKNINYRSKKKAEDTFLRFFYYLYDLSNL